VEHTQKIIVTHITKSHKTSPCYWNTKLSSKSPEAVIAFVLERKQNLTSSFQIEIFIPVKCGHFELCQ